MKTCKCGGAIDGGDPNGDICTNSGLYVHACKNTGDKHEIRAAIDLLDLKIENTLNS